jgi:hypothetical protein
MEKCKLPTDKYVGFPFIGILLHSNEFTNFIWTEKPVYRDFSIGTLEKIQISEIVNSPLHLPVTSNWLSLR